MYIYLYRIYIEYTYIYIYNDMVFYMFDLDFFYIRYTPSMEKSGAEALWKFPEGRLEIGGVSLICTALLMFCKHLMMIYIIYIYI